MRRIQNHDALARSPARSDALDIIEAGLDAIDTSEIIRTNINLQGEILHIGYRSYDLTHYRHIHVIGFGKASCQAASGLEKILGARIHSGIAITNVRSPLTLCNRIRICESSHPLPTQLNVEHSAALVQECESITKDDLVLVLISGGGSAMLCWPASECAQGIRLYKAANKKGLTIHKLNVVRKHISLLKGGGLAKLLYPATVVGIVFSDVPGNVPHLVASGPTYPDASTIADAQAIIDEYDLGEYELTKTPKESKWFEKVDNIVLVSNETALSAMSRTAQQLGYATEIIALDMYDEPSNLVQRFHEKARPHSIILGGGEPRLIMVDATGKGGRNQHVALTAAATLSTGQLFASIASDGMDNGDYAGALVDDGTRTRAYSAGIDPDIELQKFNDYPVLEASSDLVFTGATGANVSDLIFLLVP